MIVRLASSVLAFAATATLATAQVWPPTGPDWETDPSSAFERARTEGKGVFIYVATEGCGTHCVVMAREVWPEERVVEASAGVVCLAVHRAEQERESPLRDLYPGSPGGSDWALRFDVMAYPQMRYTDGWGQPIAALAGWSRARSLDDVVRAMELVADAAEGFEPPKPLEVPEGVAALVPSSALENVASVDVERRSVVWAEVLGRKRLKTTQMKTIFEWESDPLARLVILKQLEKKKRLDRDEAVARMLRVAVEGDNDYVRKAAIELAAEVGGDHVAPILKDVIVAVLEDRSGYSNPNNMLCAATKASGRIEDPLLLPTLERVLQSTAENNTAYHNALGAVRAIGGKHRKWKREVKRILEAHGG